MSYLPEVLEEFRIDESTELTIDDFLERAKLDKEEYKFYKIANTGVKPLKSFEENPDVNPILYTPVDEHIDSYNQYKECVYILTINRKIVKIGGTYTGMKKRHSSYNCGTRKARKKGTCSVTNYHITEAQYAAISEGKLVEWYVYDIPPEPVTRKIWNKTRTVFPKFYTFFETDLCGIYVEITGHRPLLSKNAGVEKSKKSKTKKSKTVKCK
tara:strand:- start:3173 stop:3808 length:636 start_codon:yes stop_codon:yes gene_type:complete